MADDEPIPSTSTGRGLRPLEHRNTDDKGKNLELAKKEFDKTVKSSQISAQISVRRRRKNTRKAFLGEDLVFEIHFQKSRLGDLPILTTLVAIYSVILDLIKRLKQYFSDDKVRLCFFSSNVTKQVNGLYTGGHSLYDTPEKQLASIVIQPLLNYLTSNSEITLDEGELSIAVCVLSFPHSEYQIQLHKYKNKKRKNRIKTSYKRS